MPLAEGGTGETMHLVRSAVVYAFAAAMIVGAYHAGGAAATTLLTVPSHAMAPVLAPHVGVTAEIAERVA